MAVASSPSKNSGGVVNVASGTFTSDGGIATVTLGFIPQKFELFNETDVILWQKFATQADANTIKTVAGGTMTKDTGSAIIINAGGTVTISTTAAGTSKVHHYRAS